MRRLAVFARPPREGQAKTRLSPALPPALAQALYEGMLADTLAAAAASAADERVVFWAGTRGAEGSVALPAGTIERPQANGDLGRRLAEAFKTLLDPPGSAAVIVGTDCPDLDAARIDQAFDALASADIVLGPASDGGYYLIGLRQPAPELFEHIDWSTPAVLAQTLAAAKAARRSVEQLPELDDIDTPADLASWIGRQVTVKGSMARATLSTLSRMGLLPL